MLLELALDLACDTFLCTNGPKLQGEYKSSKTWSVLVVLIATGRNQDISSHGKILVDCLH